VRAVWSDAGHPAEPSMSVTTMNDDSRTAEQVREHYEIEVELANRLRHAPREDREHLYTALYDELNARVPHHPLLDRTHSPQQTAGMAQAQMHLVRMFLKPRSTFLELGAGDCALSAEASTTARHVYAIDVSDAVVKGRALPRNVRFIRSNGRSLPVPSCSVDMAYSNQLMEHLHPEDALDQLKEIHRVLTPGGVYLCITPHRFSGPHDISKHFDTIATGFHLKEYTTGELAALFRNAGFSTTRALVNFGRFFNVSARSVGWCERAFSALPGAVRRALTSGRQWPWGRSFRSIRIVGIK
jgi:SAM-dependent methyltransferase